MSASGSLSASSVASRAGKLKSDLGERWRALAQRERRAVLGAGLVLGLGLLWMIGLQPALHTLRQAPVQIEALDAELQTMRALAAETGGLRGATPVSRSQAVAALEAATQGMGAGARLTMQGDRATLTFAGADASALRQWLELARSAARVRPLELQMSHGPKGYSGTLVVGLGAGS